MTDRLMIDKILVIDDSAALHQIYKIMLSRYNCEVISALNGQEGMNRLTEHPDVNLMIVDAFMPRISGLEFINMVKEQEAFSEVPIIFVSVEGCGEIKNALAITQGHLRKPFTSNEFHYLIEKLQYVQSKTLH